MEKKNGIKDIMDIGGWNEGYIKYYKMDEKKVGREFLDESVVKFVKKYNFDGIDVEWEYNKKSGGDKEDKEKL
jgi:GH18 family chitinase